MSRWKHNARITALSFRPRLRVLEDRTAPAVLTVTNLLDSGDGSLRAQLAAATPGDTVTFDAGLAGGTITLTSGELFVGPSVAIAAPTAGPITINGNHTTRVFEIASGATVSPQGLIVTGGAVAGGTAAVPAEGGGILNAGTLTLTDCVVSANTVTGFIRSQGGGIWISGPLSLTDCTVSANVATATGSSALLPSGGGLFVTGTTVLSGCTVSNNAARASSSSGGSTASDGGGIDAEGSGTLTLFTCTVAGNTASASNQLAAAAGAGVYATVAATLTDCTVTNNSASADGSGGTASATGGGVFGSAAATITGCLIAGNGVAASAGGIRPNFPAIGAGIECGGTLRLTDSTVVGNTATGQGSGGGLAAGTAVLTNCTVVGNRAAGEAGVYALSNGVIQLANTLVAANGLTSGPDPRFPLYGKGPDVYGTIASRGHNLIGAADDSSGWVASDLTGTSASPLDPRLDSLNDNGGPTRTVALLAESLALNAGDRSLAAAADQRGVPRGDTANIGAYQATAFYLDLSAPVEVTAGTPFAVVATARDVYARVAAGFTGTVTLHSTDPRAAADLGAYPFALADGGIHTFGGVVLYTAPEQLLYADASGLPSGVVLQVTPAAARVAYLVPSDYHAVPGVPFTVTLFVFDAYGNAATTYTGTIHFHSDDLMAGLPPDYTFAAADAGTHAFTVTLETPFLVVLTVDDADGAFTATTTLAVF